MVGIPGKSKGCITCKRRKVRCDLAKPACSRCIKADRTCEGYNSYPVFINRGPTGLQKRKRLEEARYTPLDAPQLSIQPCHDDQILAAFWDNYTSNGQTTRERPVWLKGCIEISANSLRPGNELLRQALLALAYTRAGRFRDDTPCIRQGQRYYGSSLSLMQQALYDATLARSDEVLAAARCMVLYEGLESTTDTVVSWTNQVWGMGHIIQLRRAEEFNEPLSRAILESTRMNIMIASSMLMTRSFLADEDWRTLPWQDTTKSLEQRVYDHGFIAVDLVLAGSRLRGQAWVSPSVYEDIFLRVSRSFESLSKLNDELIHLRGIQPDDHTLTNPVLSISLAGMDLLFATLAEKLLSNCPRSSIDDNADLIQRFICFTPLERRQDLARQILHHVTKCVEKEPKFVVAQLGFAINIARWALMESHDDKVPIQAVLDKIETQTKHRLTGSMRKAGTSIVADIFKR